MDRWTFLSSFAVNPSISVEDMRENDFHFGFQWHDLWPLDLNLAPPVAFCLH